MANPPPNLRARAALAVAGVMQGSSLDDALAAQTAALSAADAALLKAIAYGVVREHRLLETLAGSLLQKPLRNEPELQALLLCGLHQLRAMRVPPHAAVGETVAAAPALGKPWAKGLVNAVLRRYQREGEALERGLPATAAVRLSYPDWLVAAVKADWPDSWRQVLAAGNEPGPLTLRVNRRRGERASCLAELAAAGIAAEAVADAPDAVQLAAPLPVEDLPGFTAGRISVQDASAQLAADLLQAEPGQRVLDACSAPGGKAAHLLERVDGLDLLALDSDAQRLRRVDENLRRLELRAGLLAADAAKPSAWWDGRPFDRILLDAPCSGTGVIRRHPDIKWLRRESDIPRMAELQQRLLRALWPLLGPQGVLLYATCSLLRAEGEEVAAQFLATHADARELPIEAGWGEAGSTGRRIAPGGSHDGFYYARFGKTPGASGS
ncbi:MAG: 16S rRNA (cytosine(967)-C(5))-methyltransferase RsmB [Nevskia sp.]|nr:16S rRNA (cytosine(967)-C(5))-methyltransferase RsmB [Nevskia sp.]